MKCYSIVSMTYCYTIIKVGCVTKKLASFSWKAVLVSPWWCCSKKADFIFVFTTSSGQEGFPCWRSSSDLLTLHVSQLFFLTLKSVSENWITFFHIVYSWLLVYTYMRLFILWPLKAMQVLIMLKFYILLTLNYNLNIMTTIVLVFKNIESKDKIKYGNLYSSSKGETITNENDIDNVLQSIYTTIIVWSAKRFELVWRITLFLVYLLQWT